MILTNSSQVVVLFGVKYNPDFSCLDVELAFISANINQETLKLSYEKTGDHYLVQIPTALKNKPRDFLTENLQLKVLDHDDSN
jgi:hypothetical protein